jgi:hypothetical protein
MEPPKILLVKVQENKKLQILFENGTEKIYDCTPLLQLKRYHLLKNDVFFRAVRVDPGGYGISWNDEMDISEYELWMNGEEVTKQAVASV